MRIASIFFLITLLCACASRSTVTSPVQTTAARPLAELKNVPDLGAARRLEPGVLFYEVILPREQPTNRLWVYLPERAGTGKLPCVFIAPAGSNLFTGLVLGDGDRPEHLPYVRAGFAVISYELDGPLPRGQDPTDQELSASFKSFQSAQAGVANARMAIDYALAKIPQIDPERIYAAGHSSAATLSLLLAEREPRVKACIAYAPVTDIEAHFGARAVKSLSIIPGLREFIKDNSPLTHVAQLQCPLFLFNADDDSTVPPEQSARFAEAAAKTNPTVTYVHVPRGDHYDSMINEGVPRAIKWLKEQQPPGQKR